MKRTFTLVLLTICGFAAFAQEPPAPPQPAWKRKFQAGVNLNQASFSDNWKGGGVNAVSWNGLLNFKSDYNTEKFEWTNDFQSTYGSQRSKGLGTRKTSDRVFFESKLSYKLREKWRAFGSVTFMTQFADGYDYTKVKDSLGNETGAETATLISAFFSPAYLTEAVGIEYKPVTYFSMQFGVGGLRQTIVQDQRLYTAKPTPDSTLYGVRKGEIWRNQVVFQFVADFDKEVIKNISLKARYLLLADYAKVTKDFDEALVHRLDVNIVAKVNRYVNASIGSVLLYDHDQDPRAQFSQLLNLGLLLNLQNYSDK